MTGDDGMDSGSGSDPVEKIYDQRIRGVGVIMVQAERQWHAHAGCWFMLASLAPPTLMVAVPHEFAAATLIPEAGRFTVSLAAEDQMGVIDQFFAGLATPDAFSPGTLVTAPSGQPALGQSPGVFDCALAGRWDLGDFLLVAGVVQAAGGERPQAGNLTVNAIQARTKVPPRTVLPRAALPVPSAPPPAVSLTEPTEAVYARRRFGPLTALAGSGGPVARRASRAAVQVSHQPPRFLWAAPEADPLSSALREGASWSLSLADSDEEGTGHWVEARSVHWLGAVPVQAGARGYFAGPHADRLEAPTLAQDCLWIGQAQEFGTDVPGDA